MVYTLFYSEIFNISTLGFLGFILSSLLLCIGFLISNSNPDAEKLSAYECGFDPFEDARNVFDVKFYLISILFLIFDLETIYFFPWCITVNKISLTSGLNCFIDFIVELLIGYVYLWKIGVFDWE